MPRKAILLAWSSPTSPETDAEFNHWYDTVHMPQVIEAVGTTTTVSRQALVDPHSPESASIPRYLAVYEFDDVDVSTANAALMGAFKAEKLDMSPTIDRKASDMQWYSRLE